MRQPFLPPVFDHRYYTSQYPNAGDLSFEDACGHFLRIGKKRGNLGSPLADRRSFIAWATGLGCGQILEIGPGVKPSITGENVSYFDVRRGEEFYDYARGKGILDTGVLPRIDYYSADGSLNAIDEKFDLVFSSHCIEHVCDLVRHINEVEKILNDNGIYCLVVPDKRYCFDHFRKVSSVGDIIDRHFAQNTKFHPLQTFIDSLFRTHNDPVRHWRNDHGEIQIDPNSIAATVERWKSLNGKDPGVHAWVFTDDSFLENLSFVHESGITRLKPVRVYNTPKGTFSFCAIMQRDSAPAQKFDAQK